MYLVSYSTFFPAVVHVDLTQGDDARTERKKMDSANQTFYFIKLYMGCLVL